MQETPSINVVLSNIKAAADSADSLKNAGISTEERELETKIAEMSRALALAETAAADIRRVLEQKGANSSEHHHSGTMTNTIPDMTGAPGVTVKPSMVSCPYCRDVSKRAMHLHFAWSQSMCPHCRSGYSPPQASPGSDV